MFFPINGTYLFSCYSQTFKTLDRALYSVSWIRVLIKGILQGAVRTCQYRRANPPVNGHAALSNTAFQASSIP